MQLYQVDPTKDARWTGFVARHPKVSVFHTAGWLTALRRTYGYEAIVFTTSPPDDELKNGLVFCHVNSWLTGSRLVSLPFSDHCEPLCDATESFNFLIHSLQEQSKIRGWNYLEVRPVDRNLRQSLVHSGFLPGAKYFLHRLDLRPHLEEVFGGLDEDSVQRRIRHAERAGLVEKYGRSEELLREFYKLFVLTRGRHHLPPPPFTWFGNLIRSLRDAVEIRIAYKDQTPIAAILTLRFRNILYYKYGCSDSGFNKFGATPWLLWKAIEAAKSTGADEFDMGRTEEGNTGLLAFKNHWVSEPEQLVYWDFPKVAGVGSVDSWKMKIAKRVLSPLPRKLLAVTGRLIYRHIG